MLVSRSEWYYDRSDQVWLMIDLRFNLVDSLLWLLWLVSTLLHGPLWRPGSSWDRKGLCLTGRCLSIGEHVQKSQHLPCIFQNGWFLSKRLLHSIIDHGFPMFLFGFQRWHGRKREMTDDRQSRVLPHNDAPLLFTVRVEWTTPSKKRRNKDCQGLLDFRSVFDILTIASGLFEDCLKTFQLLLRIVVALEFVNGLQRAITMEEVQDFGPRKVGKVGLVSIYIMWIMFLFHVGWKYFVFLPLHEADKYEIDSYLNQCNVTLKESSCLNIPSSTWDFSRCHIMSYHLISSFLLPPWFFRRSILWVVARCNKIRSWKVGWRNQGLPHDSPWAKFPPCLPLCCFLKMNHGERENESVNQNKWKMNETWRKMHTLLLWRNWLRWQSSRWVLPLDHNPSFLRELVISGSSVSKKVSTAFKCFIRIFQEKSEAKAQCRRLSKAN